ncbi:trehalose-phosphatase [Algoriphagus hitonicola]|uniref:Trehalose 6-phosphate phosphatase n=1 Tax=Algoriphagus hitonicola TaxID=435880 RepID=A0A1I2T3F4_9BACT|nr:trehalose-phosphatase [Algoriphagus hitonicola]SFG57697.1 trehalose-phosphatase [Algoriphagus hitonicola]
MRKAEKLPDAIQNIEEIFKQIGSKQPALFLDYDGTSTPIVPNPEDAILSVQAKKILKQLSQKINVSMISGRDREDVAAMVDLNSLIYAGSHGFDISGPNGLEMQYQSGMKALPDLDEAEKNLTKKLKNIKGCKVERKKFAIAVHFRNVDEQEVGLVKNRVEEELKNQDRLKKGTGKKIIELKPDLDWHKGKALTWLMKKLDLNGAQYIPIFIGDDVTDEDAQKVVEENGIGIIVDPIDSETSATYKLKDPEETIRFLAKLNDRLKA